MSSESIFTMAGPTEWATPPARFSYSSLTSIETCPRRWHLENARYGSYGRLPIRPWPKTVEGQIVHEVLDRLFKVMAHRGLPEMGREQFKICLREFDLTATVRRLVEEHNEVVGRHPRGASFRLRSTPRELTNRVIRLFRQHYEEVERIPEDRQVLDHSLRSLSPSSVGEAAEDPLSRLRVSGVLTEVELVHPELPFVGIVDLVCLSSDGTHLVDFKTGSPGESHEFQLTSYGVLWWRRTGEAPRKLEVRYPDKVVARETDAAQLAEAEEELAHRVRSVVEALRDTPGEARLGEWCGICNARAFCDPYWEQRAEGAGSRPERGFVDVELTATAGPGEHALECIDTKDNHVLVVFESRALLPDARIGSGDKLRMLGASVQSQKELQLAAWTEVFLRRAAVEEHSCLDEEGPEPAEGIGG